MSTSSRGWRKSEEQFNPLRIAQPLPLSAQQRGAIEVVSWAIHTRSGMCAHGARRRNNQRPATVHPRAMGQIERHLTSKEFRQRARLFITGYCRIRFNPRGFVCNVIVCHRRAAEQREL